MVSYLNCFTYLCHIINVLNALLNHPLVLSKSLRRRYDKRVAPIKKKLSTENSPCITASMANPPKQPFAGFTNCYVIYIPDFSVDKSATN